MPIQVIDNIKHHTGKVFASAVETATDIRVAVAFVSSDGLAQIMTSTITALDKGAYVEFLVGMEAGVTDPSAVRALFALSCETPQVSLLCFVPRTPSVTYHPKMYLARNQQVATAIIGSSNLTWRGLSSNLEVNVVITDEVQAEIISDVYTVYNRLKYHPDMVIPDAAFIDLFTELCKRQKTHERALKSDAELKGLRKALVEKATSLQVPKPTKKDLVGWLELVYGALPDGVFTNQQVYAHEDDFRSRYPQNSNIRAKIRQQLQVLQKLGFIEHVKPGVWRKVA